MRSYRYTFLDMHGRVGADITLYSYSDKAAYEIAGEIFPKSGFASLEMRRGRELIYRLGRTDGPTQELRIAGAGAVAGEQAGCAPQSGAFWVRWTALHQKQSRATADRGGCNPILSPREQACLSFIEAFTALEGRAPSYSEIARSLRMKERSGAAQLVTRLRRRKVLPVSPEPQRLRNT
jgi:hypothetical protein